MFKQTVLVRLLGVDLTVDDALVRIVALHLEAAGARVESRSAKKGVRRDKGTYVVLELAVEASDEQTFTKNVYGLRAYLRSLAKRRGLSGLRVEFETLDPIEGAA